MKYQLACFSCRVCGDQCEKLVSDSFSAWTSSSSLIKDLPNIMHWRCKSIRFSPSEGRQCKMVLGFRALWGWQLHSRQVGLSLVIDLVGHFTSENSLVSRVYAIYLFLSLKLFTLVPSPRGSITCSKSGRACHSSAENQSLELKVMACEPPQEARRLGEPYCPSSGTLTNWGRSVFQWRSLHSRDFYFYFFKK